MIKGSHDVSGLAEGEATSGPVQTRSPVPQPAGLRGRGYGVFAALAFCFAPLAVQGEGQAIQPRLQACLDELRTQAPSHGLPTADFDRLASNVELLETTARAARRQPESEEFWWDYIAKTVDDERIADGRAILAQYPAELAAIESRFDTDAAALVAIFGIETNYGKVLGRTDVLNAWLTRACLERRPLWVSNVFASLRLLRDGVVTRESFVGSWSGAFGMTQFIPTSFYELAVDGDGDGRIDLYASLPDALASSANHLKKRGTRWKAGVPAVIEVELPPRLAASLRIPADRLHAGRGDVRTLAEWEGAGLRRPGGGALTVDPGSASESAHQALAQERAYLFAPTGSRGPVFLATGNFDAILHYNRSEKYALAVSLLINRLKGEAGLATPWPTDDPGLSRAQIRELQALLATRGYDVGTPDGIPGTRTRDAIRSEQRRLGLSEDGRPGQRILVLLKQVAGTDADTGAQTPQQPVKID